MYITGLENHNVRLIIRVNSGKIAFIKHNDSSPPPFYHDVNEITLGVKCLKHFFCTAINEGMV